MAACLSASGTGVFARPFQKELEYYQRKLRWAAESSSDVIAAMRAYETWEYLRTAGVLTGRNERDWIRREFLSSQKCALMSVNGGNMGEVARKGRFFFDFALFLVLTGV